MLSVVVHDQDGYGMHFKKIQQPKFFKVQNQKCAMDYSSCKEMIDVLVLSLIVLVEKQQKAVTELL